MPRKAREISENGIYYIYTRSVEGLHLCTMPTDYEKLIDIISETMSAIPFAIYAFSITKCELHMVVREFNAGEISAIMKKITGSFTKYRNQSAHTQGKLFKDRFKSSPVALDDKFLHLIKSVHHAPMTSNETMNIAGYPYCSYHLFFKPESYDEIVSCNAILKYFENGKADPLQNFKIFHAGLLQENYKPAERTILSREEVAKRIEAVAKMKPCEIKLQEIAVRNRIIKKVKAQTSLAIRQIAFATQMSRNTISEILNTKTLI